MERRDHHKRHVFWWSLARPVAKALSGALFCYSGDVCALPGPLYIVANHNCDLDPAFVVAAFREQAAFVGSEHILRQGLLSRFLVRINDPIGRQKGGSAAGAVKEMLRRLKNGRSVCLFPEGNRSFDGVTRPFPPATGKLARASGATLVTFRISGGYLSNPRWGEGLRRGRVRGVVAGIYPPEKLRAMTEDAVNAAIAADLFEDAWEAQRAHPVPYRGRRLAEHLETLLFTCPACGKMHRMQSAGSRFFCRGCGYEVRYDAAGFFTGRDVRFDTVRAWNLWQDGQIAALCRSAGEGPIFTDTGMALYEIDTGRRAKKLAEGTLRLFRGRLELPGGLTIPAAEISGMSVRGQKDLFVSRGDRHYLLKTPLVHCTVKYLTACARLGSAVGYGV
ncbi:MAG TPA: 1-acyl-sn-glycerol-3-phosphate acyltransferase [Oscillospiraceae bacterium]|nr:1-acyl-sn-glycerol-3-phosphate acyltransferase [Oscillospiraceae bacterium]